MSIAHTLSVEEIEQLRTMANNGQVAEAWQYLAQRGDSYADNAYNVVSGAQDAWSQMFGQLVKTHWDNTAGPGAYEQHFDAVAVAHLNNYLTDMRSGYFPTTEQIERSYRSAVEDRGLPAETAFDGVWAQSVMPVSWGLPLLIEAERRVPSTVFADISPVRANGVLADDLCNTLKYFLDPTRERPTPEAGLFDLEGWPAAIEQATQGVFNAEQERFNSLPPDETYQLFEAAGESYQSEIVERSGDLAQLAEYYDAAVVSTSNAIEAASGFYDQAVSWTADRMADLAQLYGQTEAEAQALSDRLMATYTRAKDSLGDNLSSLGDFVGGMLGDLAGLARGEPRTLGNLAELEGWLGVFDQAEVAPPSSPIVLDLDGDGVETVAVGTGAYFDHDGNGFAESTGWVATDDALLAWDRNADGRINDGSELFGNHTILAGGARAANGFQALAELDANSDGKVDASDAGFANLRVWRDLDGDGYSAPDELCTLDQAGVQSIGTGYGESAFVDVNGNAHKQIGSFVRADGTAGTATDVWFTADAHHSIAEEWLDVSADIAVLPDLMGSGNVYDLHQAMARDAGGNLKALVQSFVQEADIATRSALLEQILFKWVGAQGIDPECRGPNIDARRLHVMEQFAGRGFLQWGSVPNPTVPAGVALEQAYQQLFEAYYAGLTMQTHLASLYGQVGYTWDDISQTLKPDYTAVFSSMRSMAAANLNDASAVIGEFVRTSLGQGSLEQPDAAQLIIDCLQICPAIADSSERWLSVNGLMIGGNNGDHFYGGEANNILLGRNGDDLLYGEDGEDVLFGGAGSDRLYGGIGDDTYIFWAGSGQDTVWDSDSTVGNVDTIKLVGVAPSGVTLSRPFSGTTLTDDLVLKLNSTGDQLTLQHYFASSGYKIERVLFDDGTIWGATELEQVTLLPTAAGVVYLTAGGDTVDLRNAVGNTVFGGAYGSYGYGNDTYLFGAGGGQDTIYDYDTTTGNLDTVRLTGVAPGDVSVLRPFSGTTLSSDLVLKLNGTGDQLTLQYYFASSGYKIEQVQFDDGTVWSAAELDRAKIAGTEGIDTVAGTASNDFVDGLGGSDTLSGGIGNDLLQGGSGDDAITDTAGNNYFNGGAGNDAISGGMGGEFFMGGTGGDRITTGAGNDVVAINRGDGADTLVADGNAGDTLSLGGGIAYNDLALRKNGNHLVLETGGTDSITFENWYAAPTNPSVVSLQVIAEAMAAFNASSTDPLLNKKVQQFNFMGLVGDFDTALAANPAMTSWAVVDSLLANHLASSDNEALGGDLAYYQGRNNTLAGMGFTAAQDVLTSAQFGAQAQTLRPLQDLQQGAVRLG